MFCNILDVFQPNTISIIVSNARSAVVFSNASYCCAVQAPCPPVSCNAEIEAAGLDAAQEQLRAAPEKIAKRESPQEEKPQPAATENVSNQEEEPQHATTEKVSKKESPQKDKQPAAEVKKKEKKQPVKQVCQHQTVISGLPYFTDVVIPSYSSIWRA